MIFQKLRQIFFLSLRIFHVCMMLLVGIGISKGDNGDTDDSGALRIETQADALSAEYGLKVIRREDPGKPEDDKKRKALGIGEIVTLTLTGKPMGKIDELTWSFLKGKSLVRAMEANELKGETEISITVKPDLTPRQLKANSFIQLKVTTSEGRTVNMDAPFQVFFPKGITGMHEGNGTSIGNPNNNSATSASMKLILQLSPDNVNFSNIKIIERDDGSVPEPKVSLDPGHEGAGCDVVIETDNVNRVIGTDHISGGFHHHTIHDDRTNPDGIHKLPQTCYWKCSFQVHNGEGGPDSKSEDRGQIGNIIKQKFDYSRTIQSTPTRLIVYSAKVSKFSCSVERTSTDRPGAMLFTGPTENQIDKK